MKQVLSLFFLFYILYVPANAFRQSFGRRRLAHRNSLVRTRRFSTTTQHDVTLRHCFAATSSRRQTLSPRHRFGWTKRYSSSTDQQDSEIYRVISDTDVDEDIDDAICHEKSEIDNFFDEAERDANRMNFPKGNPEGYYVTKQYSIPQKGFENLVTANTDSNCSEGRAGGITQEEVDRLGISGKNITLHIALMLLDAEVYPTVSRARKACRSVAI